MTLSMHQASAPLFARQLRAMASFLAKSEDVARDEALDQAVLTGGRLAPDMFPLTRQVQIACDMAKGCVARLAGQEVPSWPDDETSFADLAARIDRTVAYIEGVPAAAIDGSEERPITIALRDRTMEMTGQPYLLNFVLPNFYFHVATAYAILRHQGMPLEKRDFIGGV